MLKFVPQAIVYVMSSMHSWKKSNRCRRKECTQIILAWNNHMTTQCKFGVFICYGKQMVLYSCKMSYHARLMYSSQTLWLSSNITKTHCATEHHSHAMPIEMFDMNIHDLIKLYAMYPPHEN